MRVGVIGVPTSAAAFAPGQEKAPKALRKAGLLDGLRRSGIEVCDHGDSETRRWRPDRDRPRAQNLDSIVAVVRETSRRVQDAIADGEMTLVLGGDCTVGIATVSGHLAAGRRVGLVYFDTHADLNVPDAVPEGALDWMGLAHMLAVPGALDELVGVGARVPLLAVEDVVLLGWGPEQATAFERDVIEQRDLSHVVVDVVAADPEGAAGRALELLEERCDHLLVHFDVDVIDFTDVPLSENAGRNEGLSFDIALRALHRLLASPKLAGLTITELNPDHAEAGAGAMERFVTAVIEGLAGGRSGNRQS